MNLTKFRTDGITRGAKKQTLGHNLITIQYEPLSKYESEIVILPFNFPSVLNNENNSKSDPTLLVLNHLLLFYFQREFRKLWSW